MRVLMVSKALVVAAYRAKLTELARLGVEITAVVPAEWQEGGGRQGLERAHDGPYALVVSPLRWNGHFHVHYYPQLPRLLRTFRPDILHMDEEPFNLATYLATRAAFRRGIPSLFFSWQNLFRRYPPPFAAMERAVYRFVAHGLAGTGEVEAVLRRKGYVKPLTVVPQFGIDPEVFSPGGRAGDGFAVGFLNRLIPGKAPLLTLEAFDRLPKDSRLTIVGDGPLRAGVEAEIERRGLSGRVTLRPRVPSAQVPDLIRELDAVVLPSLTTPTWKEQFGRVLIEAMACAVPVVGSDSGEIPQVIGDAGLVVPEGDAVALSDALRRLYDDPGLRRELGERGRCRVLRNYTHARVAQLTYGAYLRMLEEA
ncbi:MAG: glycosyltransferase family 4 protein [Chloroflexi bacterium]|nr:glycosyltransferase family 4 protein [Chloroflexota bacterium]